MRSRCERRWRSIVRFLVRLLFTWSIFLHSLSVSGLIFAAMYLLVFAFLSLVRAAPIKCVCAAASRSGHTSYRTKLVLRAPTRARVAVPNAGTLPLRRAGNAPARDRTRVWSNGEHSLCLREGGC